MSVELGPTGMLAKVTAVDEDGRTVCLDFRNGSSGTINNPDPSFSVGDVLLVIGDSSTGWSGVQKMPAEAWPDAQWVGIVKLKLQDITVVESSGRFRVVPTTADHPYDVGNTVLASDVAGISRVLSEQPIKYIDLPEIDDSVVERFRSPASENANLNFDDFGGLVDVVARARELIEVPLNRGDALSKIGARPIKGVLFTGAPGTGKTMLARIIAAQSGAAFYEISGPEIFSKWYGQTEELLRKLFEAAGKEDKAIIFFDEIDSVAAQRGDASHEASKRVVAQLLTLMDGFTSHPNVVVIAATNRPQDLDVALRRPGRFDWVIHFPYPDLSGRIDILRKTARKHQTNGSLSHAAIAAATDGWSAADLAQIWSEAALLAVDDNRQCIYDEDYTGGFERVSRNRNHAQWFEPIGDTA